MDVPPSDVRMGPHQCPGATEPAALSPTLSVRHLPSTMTAVAVRMLCRVYRDRGVGAPFHGLRDRPGNGVERARGP
jgi:hypothetical protein